MRATTPPRSTPVQIAAPLHTGLRRILTQPCCALLVWWALSLFALANQSMWIDEWFTWSHNQVPWGEFLPRIIDTERRPPLYHLLANLWGEAVGDSEYALRLLSIAAVSVSCALIYALGRQVLGKRAAVWALWLLALSPFWLLYGRMMRAYSLTMTLALLLTWLLWQGLRRGGLWWLIYAVAGAALLYTDYSGLAVVAAHGLYLLFTLRRQGWRRIGGWFVAVTVMGLAFTPWLAVVATQVTRDVRITDLAGGPVGFALKLATPFFSWGAGESIYPWHPLGLFGATAAGVLWLWGLGAAFHARRDLFWLLLWSFVLPLLFTATLLTLIATDITFLNAAARSPAAAPFFYLAIANGVIAVRQRWLRWAMVALIFAGFAAATANYHRGEQLLNPIYVVPARAVAAELAAVAGPNDLILAEPDTLVGYYYYRTPGAATLREIAPAEDVNGITDTQPEAVYIVTFGRDSTLSSFTTDRFPTWLARHYQLSEEQGYAPVAPRYQAIKQRLTGRPAYAYKLTVQKYTRY